MSAKSAPQEVFLSYAPEDEPLCLKLEKHLSLLKQKGLITVWHKGRIGVGTDRNKELYEHLSVASVIVLLLSSDFAASEACISVEMSLAMERHKAGETSVIPVLLRPTDDWRSTLPRSPAPRSTGGSCWLRSRARRAPISWWWWTPPA